MRATIATKIRIEMRYFLMVLATFLLQTSLLAQNCTNLQAGPYPCTNVDLLSQLSVATMGGTRAMDIWGWRDSQTGKEYALVCLNNGMAFVDVSNSSNPQTIGHLPTSSSTSAWRDVKVYGNHAFIVSEAIGHGMQVFDLTRLRGAPIGTSFTADTTLTDLGNGDILGKAHNMVMDFDRGIAYPVGSNLADGGLVAIDVSNPKVPVLLGYFSQDGYTHDAQIIQKGGIYYVIASNIDHVTVVNTTDPGNMSAVTQLGIPGSGYIHQGWATPDLQYFLVNDELDERSFGHNTRTHIFDISSIESPQYLGFHEATTGAIDHNLYTMDDYVFQANYEAGLQIYSTASLADTALKMVGYFDTYTSGNSPNFAGAWSVYPYFGIDKILVSNIGEGLFVLSYNGNEIVLPVSLTDFSAEMRNGLAHLSWSTESEYDNHSWEVEHSLNGKLFTVIGHLPGAGTTTSASTYSFSDKNVIPGKNYYRLRQIDIDGKVSHSEIRSVFIGSSAFDPIVYPTIIGSGDELNWRSPADAGEMHIISLDGQLLCRHKLTGHSGHVSLCNLPGGHYQVKFNTEGKTHVQKIVILP